MSPVIINLWYVVAAALFIFGLKQLSSPATAVRGNILSSLAMVIAIGVTLFNKEILSFQLILIAAAFGAVIGAQFGTRAGALLRGEQLRGLLALMVLAVCLKLGFDLVVQPSDLFSVELLK